MKVIPTEIPGVLVLEPRVFEDARGFFLETFNARVVAEYGVPSTFLQDNWSRSVRNTVRGLHFQHPNAQGKLVWVTRGAVWDVVVDVRVGSPTFGRWVAAELSDQNRRQMWIPPGFAHGFCALGEVNDFAYKCTTVRAPECERTLLWNDPALSIDWPVEAPLVSEKDAAAKPLAAQTELPRFEG